MKASRWPYQYCVLAPVSIRLAIAIAQTVFSFLFVLFCSANLGKRDRFFPVSRQFTLHIFLQTVWVYPMARKFILLQELWMLFVPLLRMGRRLGGSAPSGQTEFSSSRRPLYVAASWRSELLRPEAKAEAGLKAIQGAVS